jgi:hypothetical protein
VNLNTSNSHCGRCNNACPSGSTCSNGSCVSCSSGLTYCSSAGGCVDLNRDANNCGTCGKVCGSGKYCNNGTCATPSPNCTSSGFPYDCYGNGNKCCPTSADCTQSGSGPQVACLDKVVTNCDPNCEHVYNGACEQNSNLNCGSHGNRCGSNQTCYRGECRDNPGYGQTFPIECDVVAPIEP